MSASAMHPACVALGAGMMNALPIPMGREQDQAVNFTDSLIDFWVNVSAHAGYVLCCAVVGDFCLLRVRWGEGLVGSVWVRETFSLMRVICE